MLEVVGGKDYILYTKFMADANQCAYAGTSHTYGLSISSKK